MIDLTHAKKEFAEYLSHYDRTDEKIRLKAIHTERVLEAADSICLGEGVSEEDHSLALLIALLHDIGRFEQLKTFHSFNDQIFDHAKFGAKVLFEDGLIGKFITDRQYDGLIEKAIRCHSLYELPEGLSARELLQCRVIRDADKLDNFRVKVTERVEALFDTDEELVAAEPVTPAVLDTVRSHRCVLSSDRVTHMDCWVSYLAFIFDLNFRTSFRWIQEQDYMNRNIDRIHYRNPQTRRDMEEIRKICNDYIWERAQWRGLFPRPQTQEERLACRARAAGIFAEKVSCQARRMGVDYHRITIREQKTRWGSCSAKGNLNFNWRLLLAPEEVLDYVVIHELAHRREMNHSARFWQIVEEYMPEYRRHRTWLRRNGGRLMEL